MAEIVPGPNIFLSDTRRLKKVEGKKISAKKNYSYKMWEKYFIDQEFLE